MKIIISILLSLLLISCGNKSSGDNPEQTEGNRRFDTSDTRFDPYKTDFVSSAANFGVSLSLEEIPINFGNLDEIETRTTAKHSHFAFKINEAGDTQTVGVCIEYGNGLKEILLRESSWQTLSEVSREILIFHEIGHCDDALDLDHKDTNYKGYDLSVMNSLLISPVDYIRYYDEYLEELFTGSDQALRTAIDQDLL